MISLPDFDPVATSEDWLDTIELTDADTGSAIDFTGWTTWTLEARLLTPNGVGGAVVTGTYSGGHIAFPDGLTGGVINLTFRLPFADEESGRYRVTITASNGTDTITFLSHIHVLNLTESPA